MNSFCFQCEQTFQGTGCTEIGMCGKDQESSLLQDLIGYACKGLGQYAHHARELGVIDEDTDQFMVEALFSSLTNVNFDPERLGGIADALAGERDKIKGLYEDAARAAGQEPKLLDGPAAWTPQEDLDDMIQQGEAIGLIHRRGASNEDIFSLQELVFYGLKGLAAYAFHAQVFGATDPTIYAFIHEALNTLTEDRSAEDLTALALKTGEVNLTAMALLDGANTGTLGHPEPTTFRTTPIKGKAILISGHDLKDLKALLEQTEGKGINIYTHGEMLPAHGYPELKKHAHLVGNYGGAWQNQIEEFKNFPGSILMTTNCIQRPDLSYKDRIFTCGPVAWPEVAHIEDDNYGPLIEAALAAPGFEEDAPEETAMTGFARNAVMGVAGQVIDGVKSGAIRHFFLIGGCDGAKPGRNYYTELAEQVPDDCVILTLACGKYRFNKLDFGNINGIPRLLDIGQCNDAYSAIQIAVALANAFETDVNGLPLSMVLSWYEQKAVVILLTLLNLGIKNIRLGPSLPAFISPNVLNLLVEYFQLTPITTPEADLQAMLGA